MSRYKIRIGNDLLVKWSFFEDEMKTLPLSLTGRVLSVYLSNTTSKWKLSNLVVEDNSLVFPIYGVDQQSKFGTGIFSLTCIENEGQLGQHVLDILTPFLFVSQAEQSVLGSATGTYTLLETSTVIFESSVPYFCEIVANKERGDALTDSTEKYPSSHTVLKSIEQSVSGTVRFDEEQELTDEQKQTAKNNIGVSEGPFISGTGTNSAVLRGTDSTATGTNSVAEGNQTKASGKSSHAEGDNTIASGESSHAEGDNTKATASRSHAEGMYTQTTNRAEHAEGNYNKSHHKNNTYGDAGNTQHSIGIGISDYSRKNAFEVMQNGDAYLVGVGGYDGTNPEGATSLQEALEGVDDIKDLIPAQATPENQLADKDFVNSSIATNTSTFRGTFNGRTTTYEIDNASESEWVNNSIHRFFGGITFRGFQYDNKLFVDVTRTYDFGEWYAYDLAVKILDSNGELIEEIDNTLNSNTQRSDVIVINGKSVQFVVEQSAFWLELLAGDGGFNPNDINWNNPSVDYFVAEPNDYLFNIVKDTAGNTMFDRYKYTTNEQLWEGYLWAYEYTLNNSSFTAAQWAAISSGITAQAVTKLGELPTNAQLTTTLAGKQDKLIAGTGITIASDGKTISVPDLDKIPFEAGEGTNSAVLKGGNNIASGKYSVAEGIGTQAGADGAHTEGYQTSVTGTYGHAEGSSTQAASHAHAEGDNTKALGGNSHAEGRNTTASGGNSHAEGINTTVIGNNAHAEGNGTTASGDNSHAEGNGTTASGLRAHAEGYNTLATASSAHAEGYGTESRGAYSHAENSGSKATGSASHAEGNGTESNGNSSHAEGYQTKAKKNYSHAEGNAVTANGIASHAEGNGTESIGENSHAEGSHTVTEGENSHAEGYMTGAQGENSHAEGYITNAYGDNSHSEGYQTESIGDNSHSEGRGTHTSNRSEHAAGEYNKTNKTSSTFGDAGNTLFSLGIGVSIVNRKNAVEVMQNGDAYFIGLGGYDGTEVKEDNSAVKTLQEILSELQNKVSTINYIPEQGINIYAIGVNAADVNAGTLRGTTVESQYIKLNNNKILYSGLADSSIEFTENITETSSETVTKVNANRVKLQSALEIDSNGGVYIKGLGGYAGNESSLQLPSKIDLATHFNRLVKQTLTPSAGTITLSDRTLYDITLGSGTYTIALASAGVTGLSVEYSFILRIGATAPTINWPTGVVFQSGQAPTIAANKVYEVSIENNLAIVVEYE